MKADRARAPFWLRQRRNRIDRSTSRRGPANDARSHSSVSTQRRALAHRYRGRDRVPEWRAIPKRRALRLTNRAAQALVSEQILPVDANRPVKRRGRKKEADRERPGRGRTARSAAHR